jgi:hypothetical protein
VLGLGEVDDDELYAALDWLRERQPAIEATLAKRHLSNGTLVLYDVSSSYMEGSCCPLAKRGYSRDGKKGSPQIVIAPRRAFARRPALRARRLSRRHRGVRRQHRRSDDPGAADRQAQAALRPRPRGAGRRPRHDPPSGYSNGFAAGTLASLAQACITEDIKSAGLDWITSLRAPAIKDLLNSGALQLTLFDQRDMASITSPDFPGERLVVCRNPDLAAERTRKREDLLVATEKDLAGIKTAVGRKRNPLRGTAEIALKVGEVLNTYKMKKHFDLDITDTAFSFARKTAEITAEAATDGIYVVRTSLAEAKFDDAHTVRSYKSLNLVERGFRCIKTVDLHVPPVYHWLVEPVRAHVFLCMMVYYLEWHMRQRLAPMLFDDTGKEEAEARRRSVVAPAKRSKTAVRKQTTGLTEDGLPVHSFRSLLADLATLARNTITTAIAPLTVLTRATPIQQNAFDLPGSECSQ